MLDDINPDIIGITESWSNNDITDAELGLAGCVMFKKDILRRRGGGVSLYIRRQRVVVDGDVSILKSVLSGVPQ